MPIVQKLMDSLKARYGPKEGERVYYAMEAEGKGPFAPGAKHRDLHEAFVTKHGLSPAPAPKKKPAPGRTQRPAIQRRR